MTYRMLPRLVLLIATALPAMAADSLDLAGPSFSSKDAIAQRLAEVRSEQSNPGTVGDPEREGLLQQLEVALLQHREAIEYLSRMRGDSERLQDALRSWKGFARPPPYTVRLADRLHAEEFSLRRQLQAAQSRLRIIEQIVEETNNGLEDHQSALRRFREEAELAGSTVARRAAEAAAIREEISSRIAAETLARMQLRRSANEIQKAALQSALELALLKIEALRGKVQFLPGELESILQQIEQERAAVRTAVLRNSSDTGANGRQQSWKLDIFEIETKFWTALYSAFNAGEVADREAALGSIRRLKNRVDDWVELVGLHLRDPAESEAETAGGTLSMEDVERVVRVQRRLDFALEELGQHGLRGPSLLNRITSAVLTLWDTELYLAEETASIAGEKVTTYRAVTLGKLLRLALILLVGWVLLRFLSRLLRTLLLHRPVTDAARAELVRSWTFGLGLALLIIYGLNRVHIPFTAFAFLGGTLAIGIGFGAQTLLKNFISGVILSLERPFKVGDMVEVDGIMGYIRRIGLRASVIQHFDGTETLVPNSTLLENRVSNWTYGDTAMRGQVQIGVAYGTPTRDVACALLAIADEHGLVLKQPEPEVRFEAFGDNALQFCLMYWFDATSARREPLASDLRFMIDKAFVEAGIVVAYPQRDIHFDESKPLRIELSRTTTGSTRKKLPV